MSTRFPDVANRHLIFCINSGRSGSKYLAALLGTARQVRSFHEAPPKMNAEFITMINDQPLAETREQRRIKSDAIAQSLRDSDPATAYAETNHTFIKTFYDVVLEDFQNVDIVILRRDLAAVLKSFIELGYFSPRNPLSLAWMSSPNAATAALRAIGPDSSMDQWELCIAYLLDVEARAQQFKARYPSIPTHEVRLENLNNQGELERLFGSLRIEPTAATVQMCGQAVNERERKKEKIGNPTTIEQCRRRIGDYISKAQDLGITIPPSAAIQL